MNSPVDKKTFTLPFNLVVWYYSILFYISQGTDYEEFVSAAKSDNEIQFVEVNQVELAKVLYPAIKPTGRFLGIVKSEPERYTAYGASVFGL